MESNLTLAYGTIAAKNGIISAWEVKFIKWDAYRVELEAENQDLHDLTGTQRSLIGGLERELRISRIGGKVKNLLVIGLAGYLAYSIASK